MFGEEADGFGGGRKCTTWPITPGRRKPSFAPISFRTALIALPVAFKAFVIEPATAPIVMPEANTTTVSVTPYFLKISLILSQRGMVTSLSVIWVCKRTSSSFICVTLVSAAALSDIVTAVALMIS